MGYATWLELLCFTIRIDHTDILIYTGEFENVSVSEIAVASFIQQASFYLISRLARRGFSLGELSIMTTAGTALCLEFWRLTRARV